jgi:Putative zinc-finger
MEAPRATGEASAGHPDANLLAAFTENSLTNQERTAVLAHLAQCADCRDYIALATHAAETESPGVAVSATGTRVRCFSPVWRWVPGAAAVLCVAAVAWQIRVELPPSAQTQTSSPAIMPAKGGNLPAPAIAEMKSETAKDLKLELGLILTLEHLAEAHINTSNS